MSFREGGIVRHDTAGTVIPFPAEVRRIGYPSPAERAIKVVRDVALIIAALMFTLAVATVYFKVHTLEQRISNIGTSTTPDPGQSTGCPFGPDDCGG